MEKVWHHYDVHQLQCVYNWPSHALQFDLNLSVIYIQCYPFLKLLDTVITGQKLINIDWNLNCFIIISPMFFRGVKFKLNFYFICNSPFSTDKWSVPYLWKLRQFVMKFRIFLNNFHSPQVSENNKLITLIKCQKAYALCLEIHQILHNMSHPSWRRNRLPMYDSRIDFNFFLTTLTDLAYTEQNTQCEIKYNAIFYYSIAVPLWDVPLVSKYYVKNTNTKR